MEPSTEQIGRFFLDHTLLLDTSVLTPSKEVDPKICGICEPSESIIPLPELKEIQTKPYLLFDIIKNRRTIRQYASDCLKKWELSLMLFYSQGISDEEGAPHLRAVPSAGALHPFETYIVINRVDGLSKGLYRYLPLDHALVEEKCPAGGIDTIASACRRPELISDSAVTFIWIAVPGRVLWKFGSRGWRYLFIEAGHICQNLYLVATALECGTCAIGSYKDDEMNCALGVDGEEQFCLYLASVGKKKK
jgi:SagB-type dehydrogenase family enzyme